MSQDDSHEPVTITDKRRIDPETGEPREGAPASAPEGSAPGSPASGEAAESPVSDEAAELKADLQRLKAEYDNYRKRAIRQEQAAAERAKAIVVQQFLPVLDDLERARAHGDLESGPLKSVADKLSGALESLGLASFGAEGDAFDPSLHEAVQHEGDGSNPVLGTVMRRGYKLGEQVLRHAMVGVVDAEPAADTPDTPINTDAATEQKSESNE
ncbi:MULTISPECIES: nucleotide exchange factor GrpE [Mycolicibacterium]|uniref:Protein GrpE n=2 Tax=Mycolicibacterium TaxID=1866885 RepID=A0A7I7ZTR6_9MYCO|nr:MULTISPECIES: nucleotide exchange factor GrpE [Mycolicibacterium]OBA91562.1 nucleotide exchange factor GrpE [Mycolicibacterium mucogenicum]TLH74292.1 nucleotide exchange factor GrpE [Mycolicibacterium phocaicum]BBZ56191.1 protein GrpE [Mycolicibacterium phocaicum]